MAAMSLVVALGLGSNLSAPDVPPFRDVLHADGRVRALEGALRLLESHGLRVIRASRLHETAPVDLEPAAPTFLNAAVLVEAAVALAGVLAACRAIERSAGRQRVGAAKSSRALDVDVLAAWDSGERPITADDSDLHVPHPRLARRAFALLPLDEVAGGRELPGGATARELLELLDPGEVAAARPGPTTPSFPSG